jgi:hypothetical protein
MFQIKKLFFCLNLKAFAPINKCAASLYGYQKY